MINKVQLINVQNAHDKSKHEKTRKYREFYEPASHAFIDEKIIFQSSQGNKIYKLRPYLVMKT